MPAIRIRDAAVLLGVSDDTVRRWIDGGSLTAYKDDAGRMVIAGDVLADFARDHATPPPDPLASRVPRAIGSSAWSPRSRSIT